MWLSEHKLSCMLRSTWAGLHNMRDPGILDPRHFYTIYAIFTRFHAIFTRFKCLHSEYHNLWRLNVLEWSPRQLLSSEVTWVLQQTWRKLLLINASLSRDSTSAHATNMLMLTPPKIIWSMPPRTGLSTWATQWQRTGSSPPTRSFRVLLPLCASASPWWLGTTFPPSVWGSSERYSDASTSRPISLLCSFLRQRYIRLVPLKILLLQGLCILAIPLIHKYEEITGVH